MRTLTISHSSLFLRFFLWVWEASPEKLNICKLFWGTLIFPAAFLQFKKAYRFIPRIAFVYTVGAVLFAALGLWKMAIFWFVLGAGLAVGGFVTTRRAQSAAKRREEKDRALSEITRRGLAVENWILDHTLFLVLDLAFDVVDSRTSKRVGGFFAVIVEYARATKQRLCPLIKVV